MKNEMEWTVDTHVLVYATAVDAPVAKQRVALNLLERLFSGPRGCIAGQVLSEFISVAIRKKAMTHSAAHDAVQTWAQTVRVLDASAIAYERAWGLVATHRYPMWDALIIAVCADHAIGTLYSEDVGSLRRPLGVHVVNPFAELATR